MVATYRQDKGRFRFYNENPKSLVSASDCVVRAIAKATGISWDEVYQNLCLIGLRVKDMPSSKRVYRQYLNNISKMEKQPWNGNRKYTLTEFAEEFNRGTYVVSIANHLTVVIDGFIYDTWDCSQYTVGNYWEI